MNPELEALRIEHIDGIEKGLPFGADTSPTDVRSLRWNILRGDMTFPLMVIKKSALDFNLTAMDEWCAENNLLLAPHGKTTMSPQMYERQVAHGAWAITVANVAQAKVCARFGIPRIFIANQVAGTGNLQSLAALINSDESLQMMCLVDSAEGVRHLAEGLEKFNPQNPLQIFIEVGHHGWRTGIRNEKQFAEVWDELMKHTHLFRVRGIEAFEGSAHEVGDLDEFLAEFKFIGSQLLARWRYNEKPMMSIGGTAYLDRVLLLSREVGEDFTVVVRSGCYITHDHGMYARKHMNSLLRIRGKGKIPEFKPALELWSYVQSRPEKGLVFLTFGKRDTSHDIDLPIPLYSLRNGEKQYLSDARVEKLNDQHAYLMIGDGVDLQIGDLVCCGISHPCTAFDKWRVLPVVNDDYDVVDLYRTFF